MLLVVVSPQEKKQINKKRSGPSLSYRAGLNAHHSLKPLALSLPQVEPFFVTLSLFDIKDNRKISADFHVDLNHFSVRQMLAATPVGLANGGGESPPALRGLLPETAMQYPKQV